MNVFSFNRSKVLNKLKHKFKFKNFKQTYTTTMSSVSANTFPDFFKSLASLAKSNMPSPKELQTKKFAKAKRAKIIANQRIVQAKIDKNKKTFMENKKKKSEEKTKSNPGTGGGSGGGDY